MKKKLIYLLVLLAFPACIYEYSPDISGEFGRPVIEGDISIGTESSFKAGRVVPFNSTDPREANVWSASFKVEDDNGTVYTESSPGIIDLTDASPERRYRLVCHIVPRPGEDTVEYASAWQLPEPAPTIGDITENVVDQDSDGTADLLSLALNLSSASESGCYKWDYEELYYYNAPLGEPSLEYLGDGVIDDHSHDSTVSRWWKYTWCWMQTGSHRSAVAIAKALRGYKLENHEFLTMDMRSQKIAAGEYYLRLIASSIPEDQYSYLNSVNEGSENTGSLFSPVPGEQVGNIRNTADPDDYAIGYIGVSTVAKRIFKISTKGFGTKANESVLMQDMESKYRMLFPYLSEGEIIDALYQAGYYPYRFYSFTGVRMWVPTYCVDCRKSGGTLDKPSGWD